VLKLVTQLDRQDPSYAEAVRTCCEMLDSVIGLLRDQAFSIAVSGVWHEWANTQPAGAITEVSQEALEQSGDTNVLALLRLSQELAAARDTLRSSIE
jgi:hypothetical protein